MARPQRLGLSAVRSEGAILPPSILQRIHREEPALGGMTPDDFGLSGLRVRESASQAWNSLQAPWRAFQTERERLSATAPTAGITRNRWLNQIAKALDYGAIDPLSDSLKLEGREFPVSHLYGQTPIHWVGFRIDLDHRTPGEKGAARMSPHGLVQLLLNASDDYLWGFVSNGLKWRILRDDNSLSRQSMVEFDLEAIFEGQLYDEFLLFYLLCHQTRVKSEKPEECWLERWSRAAANEGKRALDTLRNGVEKAIETLGQGFLKHPANQALRISLRDGTLDKQTYYRQLLRMVYRLLFLFVAEDRNLLLSPETSLETRDLYTEYYSTQRLRLLAERLRGSHRHHDLFQQLCLILGKLGQEDGCHELGLPALGGFLFSAETCPNLNGAELSNGDFLQSLRFLAVTQEGGRRTRVDYKNLASEEMGSVYESLLELHPDLSTDGTKFELRSASGNERKTTGSYYTPDLLIQCLLDTALNPVVDDAVRTARQKFTAKDGEPPEAQAILALKVIDPAVGSGHFLIAAAHRMAKRLAQARTGDDEPAPEATRRALRDVIGRCLYGIDVNPMSAELCKVALWMEALEPGKPLSFLDHHIVVGNSLLGATPELIAAGIPDDAFTPIVGDDKAVCNALKRQNKSERDGQGNLFAPEVYSGRGLLSAWERLEGLADDTLASIQRKAQYHRDAMAAVEMRRGLADAWCAAFVIAKVPASVLGFHGITTGTLRMLAAGHSLDATALLKVHDVATRFRFLHPHLAFPDVFARGGFDVVLGNPPWERIKLLEKEYFAERVPGVARAHTAAERARLIAKFRYTPLYTDFQQAKRDAEAASHFIRKSGRFPLMGRGDVNTYAVFAELMRALMGASGRTGVIVPSGIATDDTTKHFFCDLMEKHALVSLYDFENGSRPEEDAHPDEKQIEASSRRFPGGSDIHTRNLFPVVDSRFKFSLVTMAGPEVGVSQTVFAFFCHRCADVFAPGKNFTLSDDDIALLNPNTKTCPVFRTAIDATITKAIYSRVPILVRENHPNGNPWGLRFQAMFHMSNDSDRFRNFDQLHAANGNLIGNRWHVPSSRTVDGIEIRGGRWLPLYEAKMTAAFDHRAADVVRSLTAVNRQNQPVRLSSSEKMDAARLAMPMNWVHDDDVRAATHCETSAFLGFFDITSPTNARTVIASIIPRTAVGNKLPLIHPAGGAAAQALLVSALNSFACDYVARQKVPNTTLNLFYLKQIAVPPPGEFMAIADWNCNITVAEWLIPRVLELSYTAADLDDWARELGFVGDPFVWDEERRFWIKSELDAAFFHLYGMKRDETASILDSFRIVRRKDLAVYGRYYTKDAILGAYDRMNDARHRRVPYSSPLEPPPAYGWRAPLALWEKLRPVGMTTERLPVGEERPTLPGRETAMHPLEPEELVLTPPSPMGRSERRSK